VAAGPRRRPPRSKLPSPNAFGRLRAAGKNPRVRSYPIRYHRTMSDAPERLTPASPEDLADALAFALRFEAAGGRTTRVNSRRG
jgi:hypothetical protein